MACAQVLAVPKIDAPDFKAAVSVATSYPKGLARFLATTGMNAYFKEYMPGKVESACKLGIAQAIFDIRESGKSLEDNGLQVIATTQNLSLGGLWRERDGSTDTLLYNKERI